MKVFLTIWSCACLLALTVCLAYMARDLYESNREQREKDRKRVEP